MKSKSKNSDSANKLYPTASITLADRTNYLEISGKFSNKQKKGISLQSKSHSKRRKQDIIKIYKTISEQKHDTHQQKNGSISPNKKNAYYHQYFPAYQKALKCHQNSVIHLNPKPTKRLSLSNQNNNLNTNIILNLLQKLQEIYKCNLDKIFISLYQTLSEQIHNNQKQYYLMSKIFHLIENCQERKYSILQQQLKQQYIAIEENKNKMAVQIQKCKIKNQILSKTLDDTNLTIEQLKKKIWGMEDVKNRMKSVAINVNMNCKNNNFTNQAIQTQPITKSTSSKTSSQNQFLQLSIGKNVVNNQFTQKIKQYEKRQKQFISVLCILKKQGANIEKAYQKVFKKQPTNQSNQEEEEDITQIFHYNFNSIKKKKCHLKIIDYSCSEQADQSIISQVDAMSFNYGDKQAQQEVFTQRRKYKCQKELDEKLKEQLKLKIGQLYESEQLDATSHNIPTV